MPSGPAMPSIVVIVAPLACAARTVQDFTDLPFRSTVQAPQWLVSQPICGPVSPGRSRRTWIDNSRGSASVSMAATPKTIDSTPENTIPATENTGLQPWMADIPT